MFHTRTRWTTPTLNVRVCPPSGKAGNIVPTACIATDGMHCCRPRQSRSMVRLFLCPRASMPTGTVWSLDFSLLRPNPGAVPCGIGGGAVNRVSPQTVCPLPASAPLALRQMAAIASPLLCSSRLASPIFCGVFLLSCLVLSEKACVEEPRKNKRDFAPPAMWPIGVCCTSSVSPQDKALLSVCTSHRAKHLACFVLTFTRCSSMLVNDGGILFAHHEPAVRLLEGSIYCEECRTAPPYISSAGCLWLPCL